MPCRDSRERTRVEQGKNGRGVEIRHPKCEFPPAMGASWRYHRVRLALRHWKVSPPAGWKAGVTVAPAFQPAGRETFQSRVGGAFKMRLPQSPATAWPCETTPASRA